MIRVVIVDDEERVCLYLRRILGSDPEVQVVGHALSGREALAVVESHEPDAVLLDVRMPGTGGLDILASLTGLRRPPAVVMLTNYNDDQAVLQALHAGAAGFLLKSAAPADLVASVRLAAAGHRVLGPGVPLTMPASQGDSDLPGLTRRERDVLALLDEGMSNSAIAGRLRISEATVKGHVSALMTKLGCDSRLQLGLRTTASR